MPTPFWLKFLVDDDDDLHISSSFPDIKYIIWHVLLHVCKPLLMMDSSKTFHSLHPFSFSMCFFQLIFIIKWRTLSSIIYKKKLCSSTFFEFFQIYTETLLWCKVLFHILQCSFSFLNYCCVIFHLLAESFWEGNLDYLLNSKRKLFLQSKVPQKKIMFILFSLFIIT